MKIKSITIKNFKALDVKLQGLKDFNCIWSVNSQGKTTTLQVLEFLSMLMKPNLTRQFLNRNLSVTDLTVNQSDRPIVFRVEVQGDELITWTGVFDPKTLRCIREKFVSRTHILEIKKWKLVTKCRLITPVIDRDEDIYFTYEGSILSILKNLPGRLGQLRNFFRGVRVSAHTNLHALATKVRNLRDGERSRFVTLLRKVCLTVQDVRVIDAPHGGLNLEYTLKDGFTGVHPHISSSIAKVVGVLVDLIRPSTLVILDDFDQGLDSEIVERLLDAVEGCGKSVYLSTNNHNVLNRVAMASDAGWKAVELYRPDATIQAR